jgi:hypothetical protein
MVFIRMFLLEGNILSQPSIIELTDRKIIRNLKINFADGEGC